VLVGPADLDLAACERRALAGMELSGLETLLDASSPSSDGMLAWVAFAVTPGAARGHRRGADDNLLSGRSNR